MSNYYGKIKLKLFQAKLFRALHRNRRAVGSIPARGPCAAFFAVVPGQLLYKVYILEVCKSDPHPIRSDFGTKIFISEQRLIKLFCSRIGSDFDIRNKMN